jgi:hypothetical protein
MKREINRQDAMGARSERPRPLAAEDGACGAATSERASAAGGEVSLSHSGLVLGDSRSRAAKRGRRIERRDPGRALGSKHRAGEDGGSDRPRELRSVRR